MANISPHEPGFQNPIDTIEFHGPAFTTFSHSFFLNFYYYNFSMLWHFTIKCNFYFLHKLGYALPMGLHLRLSYFSLFTLKQPTGPTSSLAHHMYIPKTHITPTSSRPNFPLHMPFPVHYKLSTNVVHFIYPHFWLIIFHLHTVSRFPF